MKFRMVPAQIADRVAEVSGAHSRQRSGGFRHKNLRRSSKLLGIAHELILTSPLRVKRADRQSIWDSSDLRFKGFWLSWICDSKIWASADLRCKWFGRQRIWDSSDLVVNGCALFCLRFSGACQLMPSRSILRATSLFGAEFLPAKAPYVLHVRGKTSLLSNIDAARPCGNFQYSQKLDS